jgi:hypothetical protein
MALAIIDGGALASLTQGRDITGHFAIQAIKTA